MYLGAFQHYNKVNEKFEFGIIINRETVCDFSNVEIIFSSHNETEIKTEKTIPNKLKLSI